MDSRALLLLFAASFVNAAIPGPCMVLTFGRTARSGIRAGVAVSLGVLSADLLLVVAALGAAAGIVALTAEGLGVMKWAGIGLLCGLAVYCLRAAPGSGRTRPGRDGAAGFTVGLTSPYNLVFYLALLPQVMPAEPSAAAVMTMTVVTLSAIALAHVGAIALGLGCSAARRPGRWVDYASAATMVAVAAMAATLPVDGAGEAADAVELVSAR